VRAQAVLKTTVVACRSYRSCMRELRLVLALADRARLTWIHLWRRTEPSPCRAVLVCCCCTTRRITLPPAAHEAAAAKGKPADWLYCSELLEQTGIVVVPGRCGLWSVFL
jgi:hypothetical protein